VPPTQFPSHFTYHKYLKGKPSFVALMTYYEETEIHLMHALHNRKTILLLPALA